MTSFRCCYHLLCWPRCIRSSDVKITHYLVFVIIVESHRVVVCVVHYASEKTAYLMFIVTSANVRRFL